MMAGVTLRLCRPEESEAVLGLWREAEAHPSPTDTPTEVGRLLRDTAALLLVAEADGRLVGTVVGGWDGWRGNLYRLAVAPTYRGRGIARALVEEAVRRLVARGARRITALVEHDDRRAVGFWDSLRDLGCERDPRMMRYVLMPRATT